MKQIKKFDITLLFDVEPTIIIIGRRETGKSVLVCDILDHYTKTQDLTDISFMEDLLPTEVINDIIKFLPKNGTVITRTTKREMYQQYTHIYDEYQPSIIENIVKSNQNSFLVLDNCLYDMSWTRDTFMRNIFGNGSIMMIFTLDYPIGIPIKMREKIDYIFLLREKYIQNRKCIWEIYGGIFPSFELFCSILDDCTKNNYCLVIKNNCEESCDLFDRIFTYRAELKTV